MNIYEEYAKARLQVKILQDKMKELEPQILGEISKLSEPFKSDMGTFTTVTRESWKYTERVEQVQKEIQPKIEALNAEIKPKIDALNAQIEAVKQEEMSTGKAQKIEVTGLRFIEKK